MTIGKLHKICEALIENGHKRTTVCINKTTFNHPLEGDGAIIIPVLFAEIDTHEMLDDDGGMATLVNGQAKERTALVLRGD